ncbi:hypothetical protein [Ferruginibacter sp. HRS2-29]|uniref:hypothetical protein n=1 Tax=Ferruginibacter sp. HRS2-29 TaxID=2487334 RepID=UPI0020CEE2B7|nr:hypothetical protein [Ferruginibacter sp. HRS2-29]MCP9752334.1 hypothetical protein [Ferruginibacter sp. HRS2-29]
MIHSVIGREKVKGDIKPLHYNKRTAPELVVGGEYFVCYVNNDTYPCVVTAITHNPTGKDKVDIEIPVRAESKKGFIDADGNISHHWVAKKTVYADEIGLTREHAVENRVMRK